MDALAIGANRGQNEDRIRQRDEVAQDQPVNRLYLYITIESLSTAMNQKKIRTSYMLIISLQGVVIDMSMVMREAVEISNLR